jgi:putative ABC transport system ATP-binding protein
VSAVELESVSKVYCSGPRAVTALDAVSVGFARAEFTAVMGPSGSGKTTLLQCAAGIDRPTSGRVRIGDLDLNGLGETINSIEQDRYTPSLPLAIALARFFGKTVEEVFDADHAA